MARRPAFGVDVFRFDHLLAEADLVISVEDGEAGFEACEFCMLAKDLRADRVEGAEPSKALTCVADQVQRAFAHFAGRLVGEGDGQRLRWPGEAGADDVGEAGRQHARLARASPGQDEEWAIRRLDSFTLFGVQAFEIVRIAICNGRAGGGHL